MSITRIFNSGNSQAVRIPKSLQFNSETKEVEIKKVGNELRLIPIEKASLGHIMQKFSDFSDEYMEDGREGLKQPNREKF